MLVEIGLKSAKEGYKVSDSDDTAYRPVDGLRVLSVHTPDDLSTGEAFRTITDSRGVMSYHTDEAPGWVTCADKPALAALLAEHYGCPAEKPADVEATHWTDAGPPTKAEVSA